MNNQKKQNKAEIEREAKDFFYQGEKFREEGNLEKAVEHYFKAVEILPDKNFYTYLPFNSWHRIGWVLVELYRQEEALPYLQRALSEYNKHTLDTKSSFYDGVYLLSKACIFALLAEKENTIKTLSLCFETNDKYVAEAYAKKEFETYKDDPDFLDFMNSAIAQTKRNRSTFDAKELAVMGCDNCRKKGGSTKNNHDWTMNCSHCGKSFSYNGCSCDGCCGGTYAGFGGGRYTFTV